MVASPEWNASRYSPSRPFFVVAAVLLTFSSALGAFVSYTQGRDQKALADRQAAQLEQQRAARAKAAEAERERVAAISPEQRAAEEKERQDRVGAAAKAAAEAAARKKAEQDTALAKKKKRDRQLQTAGAGALLLKRAAKDPETFELRSAYVSPNGTACYEYRAKNSFGAILPGKAVLTTTGKMLVQEHDGNTFVGAWNKNCTVSGGDDIAPLLRQMRLGDRG
jgi:multidrug efflux pump subunit AcrA (membrane-fusion protein)